MTIGKQHDICNILRIAIAMCFIGHGSFGILSKPIWCNYFAVAGIGTHAAYSLMPVIGSVDILLGIAMLVYPVRGIALWLVVWGFITAWLRPISGEPMAELIERAGNYGAPLALLILSGVNNSRQLFARLQPAETINDKTLSRLFVCLQIIVFLVFAGHGWLNIIGKKSLVNQYTSLGINHATETAFYIGVAEIAAAFFVLLKPTKQLLLALFIWKITSELFYPHYEVFEFIERGGSYGCVLALFLLLKAMPIKDFRLEKRLLSV